MEKEPSEIDVSIFGILGILKKRSPSTSALETLKSRKQHMIIEEEVI
jgi:hypothetical protein